MYIINSIFTCMHQYTYIYVTVHIWNISVYQKRDTFLSMLLLPFPWEPWHRGIETANFVGISATSDIMLLCNSTENTIVSLADNGCNLLPQGRNLVTRVGSGTQPFVGWFFPDKTCSGLESNMGSQSTGMVGGGLQLFFFFLICVLCVLMVQIIWF